jgi:hypothetical protein
MRLAGIQANFGLDSRLKRSGRQTGEKSSEVHLTARWGSDSLNRLIRQWFLAKLVAFSNN